MTVYLDIPLLIGPSVFSSLFIVAYMYYSANILDCLRNYAQPV